MRKLILAAGIAALFAIAVPAPASADEFDGGAKITQHGWGGGWGGRRGGGGWRGGRGGQGGGYYGGGHGGGHCGGW